MASQNIIRKHTQINAPNDNVQEKAECTNTKAQVSVNAYSIFVLGYLPSNLNIYCASTINPFNKYIASICAAKLTSLAEMLLRFISSTGHPSQSAATKTRTGFTSFPIFTESGDQVGKNSLLFQLTSLFLHQPRAQLQKCVWSQIQ